MRHDPSRFWTSNESVPRPGSESGEGLDRLLVATLRATNCTMASVFLLKDGQYRRIAAAGLPLAEALNVAHEAGAQRVLT